MPSLGEVHAALAHYFQNRTGIDRELAEGAALVDETERTNVSPVAEKLKRLRSA